MHEWGSSEEVGVEEKKIAEEIYSMTRHGWRGATKVS